MEQRKLLKTIERVASEKFNSEADLLHNILKQIVQEENINITGGRIWKLNPAKAAYELLFQEGKVQKIKKGFVLKLEENPVFKLVTEQRTVLASETNQILRKKGIFKYSASGVGSKLTVDKEKYYEFLLAVNSDNIDDDLRYSLNIIATVITSRLKEWRLSSSRKHLFKDLDKAKQLQRSILPEHELHFHNYDIFGLTLPAEILGGDFYDYVKIGPDEERIGIAVGDAASKGLSAAAEAMYISGALRMASAFQIKISPLMFRLNNLINKIFSDDRFCTMFYGELSNDKKGLFLYANAGHNPPVFYSRHSKRFQYLEPTGPLLGPAPNSRFETDSINFDAGDILVIYSDGIVEAANDKFQFYDEKRLKSIIRKNADKEAKIIAQAIIDDVIKFSTNESKYQDDKTVVVIKRKADNDIS